MGKKLSNITGASLASRLQRLSLLPSGYIETSPNNFRFDQDVLKYVNRWGTATVTLNGFTAAEADILFSQYANTVNLNGKSAGCSIEITNINFGTTANTAFYPFIFMHSLAGASLTVKMEVLKAGAPTTWETAFDGSVVDYRIAEYTSGSGNLIGVRWTFSAFTAATNYYIRYLGCIGRNADGYAWNMMKGGDTMWGNFLLKPMLVSGTTTDAAFQLTPLAQAGAAAARNHIKVSSLYNAGANGHSFYVKSNSSNQFELVTDWSTALRLGVVTNSGANADATAAKYLTMTTAAITWDGNALLDAGNYTTYTVTKTGTGASGTWAISITGNAATLSGFTTTAAVNITDENTTAAIGYVSGISLLGQVDGALYSHVYSSSWKHQIFGDYRTGQLAIRGKNNGTWQAWRTVLDSSNYTSYAPTLTGTGASGSWGISVTGSAATLTTARTLTIGGTGKTFNGSANVTWTLAEIGAANGYGNVSSTDLNTVTASGMYRFDVPSANGPGHNYGQMLVVRGGGDTITQITGDYSSGDLYTRSGNPSDVGGNGTWKAWRKIVDALNYTDYTVTKTGTGASGTWSISISGSAATLTTARTLTIGSTGKTFDGSANVTWTLGEIGAQGALTLTTTGTSGAATLIGNTLNIPQYSGGSSGTVTSVGLSLPSIFSVSGSPVTTTGTLTATLANVSASGTSGQVFAGPVAGSAAPTFRLLLSDDIPSLNISKITNLQTNLDNKAPLASPTFTGTPAAPTATVGTNTTQLATTAFVNAEIANDAVLLTTNQTVAGDKTFSGTTALAEASTIDGVKIGFRDIPQNLQNAAYTFALTDRGKSIGKDTGTAYTYTIPANSSVAFPVGTAITVFNNNATANVTIAITTDTLRLGGTTTTGSRTLAPFGVCTLLKVASTVWIASGAGLT